MGDMADWEIDQGMASDFEEPWLAEEQEAEERERDAKELARFASRYTKSLSLRGPDARETRAIRLTAKKPSFLRYADALDEAKRHLDGKWSERAWR